MDTPIFYDPSGRRWVHFRRGLRVASMFLIIFLILFALSALTSPQLPTLGLPPVEHLTNLAEVKSINLGQKAAKNVPFQIEKPPRYVRSSSPVIHRRHAAAVHPDKPLVFGFYVNWDRASMASLRLNLHLLTHMVPEWLTLRNAKGDLTDDSDSTVIQICAEAHLPVLPMITNYRDGWQAAELHQLLNDRGARANLAGKILSNLIEHHFAGVNIDFEQLASRDGGLLVSFLAELRAKLQPAGMLLTESVPVEDKAYDLKRLAAINDYLTPMLYDEHYQSGKPGPVASKAWFEKQLNAFSELVPAEKTIAGLGNYGYDWIIGAESGREVSFGDVMSAAKTNHAAIAWDSSTGNPVLRYNSGGNAHEVWFLDGVTALNQLLAVSDAGFRGVALWRMGGEDPGFWNILGAHTWPDKHFDLAALRALSALQSTLHYGVGEVLRLTDTPRGGQRTVAAKPDGTYTEQYDASKYPSYYVIESTGGTTAKVIALTFDDGPDPNYTPQILDILKSKAVPATFFVVGLNAETWPALIQREFAEGHLIGNHTYSHPNIATKGYEQIKFELSATERLIENDTQRLTTLFRPPYNADSEPITPEEIEPLAIAQKFGYTVVGESIDPRDWQIGVTADGIVSEVLAERDNGHIVLLHDAGGDRSATVAALPRLIDTLRSIGYQFVPLGQLISKTRDQLMPASSGSEARWAAIEGNALDVKGNFKKLAGLLFLLAIYLTMLRSVVYGSLAIGQKIAATRRRFDPAFRPPVSVLIAAYNEEKVIARTVESILNNGYADIEVIVVDDGSQDNTLGVLKSRFGAEPRVAVLAQANAGKSAALNRAIAHATNNILVAVDADTIFRSGAIQFLVRHFSDPSIGAVSGNARVGNRGKWITRFQSIEYICGFNLDRRALDLLNAITVVPGAVGAWRKDLILAVGGFGHDTLAEDTDLTLAIRRSGHAIRYEENAVAFTEAPEDTRSLAKQRFRWAFGTLQAAWKHRDALFRYGFLGFVALPSIWLFQVVLAMLSPFAEVAMVVALFAGNWRLVLLFYLGFFGLELLTAGLAYALEGEKPYDLALLFFQRVYFRGLMHYVLAKSVISALRGRLVGWGKLERRATVEGA